MNGPEHYKRAERLLERASDPSRLLSTRDDDRAAALVHATLALAAATVDARRGGVDTWEQYPGPEVTP